MKKLFTKLTLLPLLLIGSIMQVQAQTNYRVNAFYTMNYDGSQYVRTGDSLRVYFQGNYSFADFKGPYGALGMDLPEYFLNQSNGEVYLPVYPQAYSQVSNPCDSALSFAANTSATAFDEARLKTWATLDDNENITELITRKKVGSNWENDYKEIYSYNANNQISEYIYQEWESGGWVNDHKEISTYNSAGKLQEFTRLTWAAGSWDNYENYLYEYDAAGNCTTAIYREPNLSSWSNETKTTISYDAGNHATAYLFEEWQAGAWMETSKAEVSYNSNGGTLTILSQEKIGSIWQDVYRATYIYNDTQKSECLQETFDGTVWNKTARNIYNYSGSGNLENIVMQQWDNPNSAWANNYRLGFEYNAQQLVSALFTEAWNSGNYWEKTTSSNKIKFFYESYNNTGINNLAHAVSINVYPNPAIRILHVAIDWEKPQSSTLTVYDITGRVQVVQVVEKANHTQAKIDISALPAGSYYLKIATPETQLTKGFQVVK